MPDYLYSFIDVLVNNFCFSVANKFKLSFCIKDLKRKIALTISLITYTVTVTLIITFTITSTFTIIFTIIFTGTFTFTIIICQDPDNPSMYRIISPLLGARETGEQLSKFNISVAK